jgi:hypothetical protein
MPELPDPSLAWEDLSAVDRRSLTEMLVDKIIIERHPSKIDMDGRRHYLIRAIPYQDLSKRLSGSRRFSDTLTGSGRRPRSRAGSLVGIPVTREHRPAGFAPNTILLRALSRVVLLDVPLMTTEQTQEPTHRISSSDWTEDTPEPESLRR